MNKLFVAVAVALGLAALSGCATGYSVSVSSLKAPMALPGTAYALRSGMEGVREGDLMFQEFAAYVHRALERRGYRPAPDVDRADLVVLLSYEIVPAGSAYESRYSTYYIPAARRYDGQYVVRSSSRTEPRFYAVMALKAVSADAYRKGAEVQLWQTRATAVSADDDLRAIFPLLVAGAMPHLGSRTKEQIVSFISVADEDVKYVTGKTGPDR